MLEIVQQDASTVLILRLRGSLVLGAPTTTWLAMVAEILRTKARPVVCDLSGVHTVDSSGLAALISAQEDLRRADCRLILLQPSPRLRTMLEVTQLETRVAIADTEAEALRRATDSTSAGDSASSSTRD